MKIEAIKPTTLRNWSYSTYDIYNQCRHRVYLSKILNVEELRPDVEQTALEYGIAVHEAIELFLKSETEELPEVAENFRQRLVDLRPIKGLQIEELWPFTKDLEPLPGKFHPQAKLYAKADACYVDGSTVRIYDWKTGRIRQESHLDQLELYAVCAWRRNQMAKRVEGQLFYLREDKVATETFDKPRLAELDKKWLDIGHKILSETEFAATPGGACQFCPYDKEDRSNKWVRKSGVCQFTIEGEGE